MDDYKIANNETIKKLNEEYKKLQLNNKNIKKLNLTFNDEEKKLVSDIIKNFTLEKNLVVYFNKQNEPLNECINIFKDIFCKIDELCFNLPLENFTNDRFYNFKQIFSFNYLIIKNINALYNKQPELSKTLDYLKLRQLELLSILLPFCLVN